MRFLVFLGFILAGMLLFSQALAMMELPDMPGDISFGGATWHIHIPVLFSLGAVALSGLIIWAVKR
ncbi:MAG: hypothetical protein ISS15_00460 [Alphaproteobacteria bacterium]|nr:hypothetical protein [Alphaproteobacteria bacterium]MBL6937337.1 hypothetical protein [Alphaproteobacteria bacterium]MBL7096101.1 hypothetical protein [Alphaproteobacteria bacterium]